jgi:uncharacterized membrane protein YvlD (DUF360 family)
MLVGDSVALENKKFWEERIAYFPFTVIWVSDTTRTSRKKTLVCMSNKVKYTILETAMSVLLMGAIYELHKWDGLRWHNIHTKFHNDRFKHSSNIKGIASIIWEAIVLALLMSGIYDVRRWNGFMSHDILTKFHKDWYRRSSNIKGITSIIWEAIVLVLLMGRIYDVRRWNGFMSHDTLTKFPEDWYRRSSNIKVLPQKFERL